MKRLLPILAALLCAPPLAAQMSFGGRAGMTLTRFSTADEEVEVSSIAGMHASASVTFVRGPAGLVLSGGYSERGTGFAADVLGDLDFRYRLAYVEAAALGKLPVGAGAYLLAGPTAGLRVSCTATVEGAVGSQSVDCADAGEDPFQKYDFGVAGGAGIAFDAIDFDMVVEVLYGYGLVNISDVGDDTARNRGLTLRVGLDLG